MQAKIIGVFFLGGGGVGIFRNPFVIFRKCFENFQKDIH